MVGKFACRLCGHDQYEHNPLVGCPHCWCAANTSEAAPRTDAELDAAILPPGEYREMYKPKPEDICTCGHEKRAHIYEEGACRPGFVCWAACERFTSRVKEAQREPDKVVYVVQQRGSYPGANWDGGGVVFDRHEDASSWVQWRRTNEPHTDRQRIVRRTDAVVFEEDR